MVIELQPLPRLNRRAKEAVVKEIGIVDTLRFLSRFRIGAGDSTKERSRLLAKPPVKNAVREIIENRSADGRKGNA